MAASAGGTGKTFAPARIEEQGAVRCAAERGCACAEAAPSTVRIITGRDVPVASLSDRAISDYWNARSDSYSSSVLEELGGEQHRAWQAVLKERSAEAREAARRAGRTPRALDLGCGPGFFSILFARMGCAVDAVDSSSGMLSQARRNSAAAGVGDSVSFHEGDVAHLPFPDASFDVVALRNVTWLMRDPVAAYREWRRVLVSGGALLVFDANWYRYLDDPVTDAQRIVDQADGSVLGQDARCLATSEQEARCERMAASLPLTYVDRPGWDERVLRDLGFSDVSIDADVWRAVWTPGEQAFYGSSPLFAISAVR